MSKRPSGIFLPAISLERATSLPLYKQLYQSIRQSILRGTLRKGLRLPSTRTLAHELRVSRNIVVIAFEQLLAEGYIESRTGAGTFVTATLPEDVLQVGESSLYPALQRLLLRGWVKAEWGASENNRRARYYTLSASGRKQLEAERAEFDRIVVAIHKVLATS